MSKPCRKCGGTERYASGGCIVCVRAQSRATHYAPDRVKAREERAAAIAAKRAPFDGMTRAQKHKVMGLCSFCKREPLSGKAMCAEHTEYFRARAEALGKERRAKGLCAYCTKETPAVRGTSRCEKHIKLLDEARARSYARYPGRAVQRAREWRLANPAKAKSGIRWLDRLLAYYEAFK